MNESEELIQSLNPINSPVNPTADGQVPDYGGLNDNQNLNVEDGQSQMGESVLYRDLQNQYNQQNLRENFKQVKSNLISVAASLIILFTFTLLLNKVGIDEDSPAFESNDVYCQINLRVWFMEFTVCVAVKLLFTVLRYYCLKKLRRESLAVIIGDTVVTNILFTLLFIHANIMYHSEENNCFFTRNKFVKFFYLTFCVFTFFGYLQFIYCILLSFTIPLLGLILYKLAESRLRSNNGSGRDVFSEGLLAGILQMPLPVPEILSQLNRTKFNPKKFGMQTQCAICWMDFSQNEVVTPLICDDRHLYHTTCIEQWIRKGNNSCPLCRKQIANIGNY